MGCIVYLVGKRIKNTLVEFVHAPAKLIMLIISVAAIIGFIILGASTRAGVSADGGFVDISYFQGIFFAYITLFVIIAVQKGLNTGDAIFDMSDVNLLFTAPVSPKKALIYGAAFNMSKIALMASFCILFQSGSLSYFGIGFGGLLLTLFFCFLGMILSFTLSQVIYSFSNGNEKRKLVTKIIMGALFVPLAVQALMLWQEGFAVTELLKRLCDSPLMSAIPIAGWGAASCVGFLSGNMVSGVCFLGLMVLALTGFMLFLAFSKVDFYEDVLCATETAFEKRRNALEGNIGEAMESSKKIRVKKTGLAGAGAAAFFHRHLREASRRSILGLLSYISLFLIGGSALYALLLGPALGGDPYSVLITMFSTLLSVQVFTILYGEGLKELYTPYIYLTPERSVSKILWSNMAAFLRSLIEGALIFAAAGAILRTSVPITCATALGYALFSLKLIALNYLSLRWTSVNIGAGILLLLFALIAILSSAPGAIIGIAAGITIGDTFGNFIGLLIFCAWEAIVAIVCFALSAGILDNCDMPVVKSWKG
ncbi:MAG: putative ABC exporter domain-containing protein [Treponema sp.]|jgi:hypothetical protein|nr:putative ABC exporter domain-containing protein [Treponema sp.]